VSEPETSGTNTATATWDGEMLVRAEHVKKYFPIRKGILQREVARVHAVDDVSLEVRTGEASADRGGPGHRAAPQADHR
jgi:peptide/nickel transport system ATP-binding protein